MSAGAIDLRSNLETLRRASSAGQPAVLFGHHSVGRDILDGLDTIAREVGVDVRIESARVGWNHRPISKLDDFVARLERGHDYALALVKLCYVDFTPETDVTRLIGAYRRAAEHLRSARPSLTLVHVTAPLTVRRVDWKTRARRALGRPVWDDAASAKRQLYNDTLRATFRGQPFFDLAATESTHPDGRREQYDVDNRPTAMLVPGYARDGAHLGDQGKRTVARAFARALATAVRHA